MPLWKSSSAAREALAQAIAISKSQAVIEFNMDGTIVTADGAKLVPRRSKARSHAFSKSRCFTDLTTEGLAL